MSWRRNFRNIFFLHKTFFLSSKKEIRPLFCLIPPLFSPFRNNTLILSLILNHNSLKPVITLEPVRILGIIWSPNVRRGRKEYHYNIVPNVIKDTLGVILPGFHGQISRKKQAFLQKLHFARRKYLCVCIFCKISKF